MEPQASDHQLAQRISTGTDRAAEAEFCTRMAPRLRLYGLRHLRNHDAAEDLMQQVLTTSIEALRAGRLRDYDKLVQFVLGICRMTVLDIRRGTARRDRLLEPYIASLRDSAEPPSPPDTEQLASCMQKLRERERTVLIMTYYDEKTSSDLPSFINASEANVRVIRHRALQQLRTCLEAAGGRA